VTTVIAERRGQLLRFAQKPVEPIKLQLDLRIIRKRLLPLLE
jgi:hypothetical protein